MKMSTFPDSRWLSLVSVLIFISVWALAALLVGETLLLPGPIEVFRTLLKWMGRGDFYRNLFATFIRGLGGFSLSFFSALTLGILAATFKTLRVLIQPFVVLIRSVPLLAVILLAILWFRQEQVPYFVVFLILFPLILGNVVEGVLSVDTSLLEMARSFDVSPMDQLFHVTIPHLAPFIFSGISNGLGVAWKAVVAAEILTMPHLGVGTAMQRAQLELDSSALFAWTLSLILLSGLCELLLRLVQVRQRNRR